MHMRLGVYMHDTADPDAVQSNMGYGLKHSKSSMLDTHATTSMLLTL